MSRGRAQGKRILVSGGATGLGAAIVRRLAEEGARLIIGDIDEPAGERLAAQTASSFVRLDVSSEDSWAAALASIEAEAGGLDGLVDNAGIAASQGREDIEGVEIADFHRIFAVNVDGGMTLSN